MSGHPTFCVCDLCSARVAAGHRNGDEKLGRNWLAGEGCGCVACRDYRKTLADIEAGFARIERLEKARAAVRALAECCTDDTTDTKET